MNGFKTEVKNFKQKWPEAKFVDLIFTDINATPRGKRIPIESIEKVEKGVYLPLSTISLSIEGNVVEEAGLGEALGEPDHICYPIPGTLTPTFNPEVAQIMLTMMDAKSEQPIALSPRTMLENLMSQIHSKGWYPVMAIELEFYLLDKQRDTEGGIQPPLNPVHHDREYRSDVYNVENLDDYSEFLHDLNDAAIKQGLNTSGALSESAPGQFEINFNHQQDVLNACDQVILAKRLIRQVAQAHDFDVTFMAKPFADEAGNGKHMHLSVVDQAGSNLFTDDQGEASSFYFQTLAAMLAMMPDSMALLCPNVNAYRRFSASMYTPTHANWGENHRGVALRIPMSDAHNRRIEHRIAGADVNPYILASVILAGVLASEHFSEQQCPPQLADNAVELPLRMPDALIKLASSELMSMYLPQTFISLYLACKQRELADFEKAVTPLEIDWMLHSA
ncbi:glutamine synthetase family protein [Photobacterium sp. 1_MG-2023]|uniref:glutamine synthetase family protein n=1 Tax=Photobacterium sp. 1_MG-2023 TaxID=3062646 RepID=UPI0026E480BE|nr:glutamine synthetase family protein [Photobacterium sp. 1_MG-2023]MDO6707065.1 glutamine synthetase family protein [Photobacterium sp. 1_MG-2023]